MSQILGTFTRKWLGTFTEKNDTFNKQMVHSLSKKHGTFTKENGTKKNGIHSLGQWYIH